MNRPDPMRDRLDAVERRGIGGVLGVEGSAEEISRFEPMPAPARCQPCADGCNSSASSLRARMKWISRPERGPVASVGVKTHRVTMRTGVGQREHVIRGQTAAHEIVRDEAREVEHPASLALRRLESSREMVGEAISQRFRDGSIHFVAAASNVRTDRRNQRKRAPRRRRRAMPQCVDRGPDHARGQTPPAPRGWPPRTGRRGCWTRIGTQSAVITPTVSPGTEVVIASASGRFAPRQSDPRTTATP